MEKTQFDVFFNGVKYSLWGYKGDHIANVWWQTGAFYEVDLLHAIAARNLPGAYIDVGAHVGNHTVFFASECPATSVIAIEPNDPALVLLEANIHNLRVSTPVRVFGGPVGNRERVLPQEVDRRNLGMFRYAQTTLDVPLAVETTPLDEVWQWYTHVPDDLEGPEGLRETVAVLKIDVEGFELQVLRGAANIIRTHKPLIAMEARDEAALVAQTTLLQEIEPVYVREPARYCATPTFLWSAKCSA